MKRLKILIFFICIFEFVILTKVKAGETLLSTVLTATEESKDKTLTRQGRSYYDQRYGAGRPYDRRGFERPSSCGRCQDDRYDDRDEGYDRSRDRDRDRNRYDDDRPTNRPTSGNRHDSNKGYGNEEEDRRYNTDRRAGDKNETNEQNGDHKNKPYDDKNKDPALSGSKRYGNRDRDRERDRERDRDRDRDRNGERDRNRYDDRDRYGPDYYDRFLRDPYRDRARPYDDGYRERRPLFERYPERYDDPYAGRYDNYFGYRRPAYDDRGAGYDRGTGYDRRIGYDRGTGYDSGGYGGYGPGVGRGVHDSFRPWDETYRGQAGWDEGGRGYYFASGRPEAAPSSGWETWGRTDYSRPQSSGWQNVDYSGYRDQLEYRGSLGYPQDTGYRQDLSTGYARPTSGWHSVGERRPYRDQSGVPKLDGRYEQPTRNDVSGQTNRQPAPYGQTSPGGNNFQSTTPQTSYLFQREDEMVTVKPPEVNENNTPPS